MGSPGALTSAVNPTTKSTFRETGLVSETVETSSQSVLLAEKMADRKQRRALRRLSLLLGVQPPIQREEHETQVL